MNAHSIINAYRIISKHLHETPILTSTNLNILSDAQLYFKCENFQKGGAFKARGACYNMSLLQDKEKGVCTHSSGNHGSCLAMMATKFGIKSHIVIPENAPKVKINAIRSYGGQIHFCGNSIQDRIEKIKEIQQTYGSIEIHPYDNDNTIIGQSTACFELLKQTNYSLDYVIAPVNIKDKLIFMQLGGGGLCSGTILCTQNFSPLTKVIGVEPLLASDAYLSLQKGQVQPQMLPIKTIADGLRTSLSERTFSIIRQGISEIITVDETEIIFATKLIWETMKILVETSSAVVLAAVLKRKDLFSSRKVGLILSGGNVDMDEFKKYL